MTCTVRIERGGRGPGTSPTRRSDIVLNVHDMRDVPDDRATCN